MSQEKKKPNGCLITILVIVGVFIFFGVIGSLVNNNDGASTSSGALVGESKNKDLELLEHTSEIGEFGNLFITGTVKNNTKKQYTYVQVEINLYDDDDAQVGSTMANTNNLEPGGKWKFKAVVIEENVKSYKIKDITGF